MPSSGGFKYFRLLIPFWMIVIVKFSNCRRVLRFGAPSRYNHKGALTQKRWFWVNWTSFRYNFNVHWKKNQNKHSKFNTKFVIRRPVEMTWSALKLRLSFPSVVSFKLPLRMAVSFFSQSIKLPLAKFPLMTKPSLIFPSIRFSFMRLPLITANCY